MALRGWRLFGVAGTIFAYVAGILLLSILSLNNPNQRRGGGGRFGEFDAFRHREINLIKRQPLQWCQPLRYLDGDIKDITTKKPKQLETFIGHYVRIPKKHNNRRDDLSNRHQTRAVNDGTVFDDGFKAANGRSKSKTINDKTKSSYDKIWPNNKYLRNQNSEKLLQKGS